MTTGLDSLTRVNLSIVGESYAKASLPTDRPAGALAIVTDDIRGLWRYTGSEWISVTGVANVKDFGAKGDGKRVTDAVLTSGSGVVTSATAAFTPADVGKLANAWKEGGTATIALGTIASYQSATQVTLSNNASSSASGCILRWGTDDRTAINDALAAVVNRGGGRVYIPRGIYKLSGTFNGTTNSLITFPALVSGVDNPINIVIEGEAWDYAGAIYPFNSVVIDATGITGSGTQPSVIAPKAYGTTMSALSDFCSIQPRLRDLKFSVSPNPSITGLQFHNAPTLDLDRVTVQVDSISGTPAEPTNNQSYGVIFPGRGNDVKVFARSSFVQGFYNGCSFSEHLRPLELHFRKCKQAMIAESGFHMNIGSLLIEQCGIFLVVDAANRMDLTWTIERNDDDAGQWYGKQTYDITDTSNLAAGRISYINALSNTGVSGDSSRLTRNGAFNIQLKQVDNPDGDLVVVRNSADINIANDTVTVLTFDTDDQDLDAAHSTSSNTDRINPVEIGQVHLSACVRFEANATGIRSVQIRKWISGTPFPVAQNYGPGDTANATTVTVACHATSSAGHYFDVVVYQNSGVTLKALAAGVFSPRFTLSPIK